MPFLKTQNSKLPERGVFLGRGKETVLVDQTISLAAGDSTGEVLVALAELKCGERSRATDCYAGKSMVLGDKVHARALLCDGELRVGSGCKIDRWLDAELLLEAGEASNLGRSVSCGGELRLGCACRFFRAFGLPLTTHSPFQQVKGGLEPTIEKSVLFTRRRLSLPDDTVFEQDIVVHGTLIIGKRCTIRGSIKAYGSLFIDDETQILGDVISRKKVTIRARAHIAGHIFAEGDVEIGQGASIGDTVVNKSIYTTGFLRLRGDVRIYGWAIAERGGIVI